MRQDKEMVIKELEEMIAIVDNANMKFLVALIMKLVNEDDTGNEVSLAFEVAKRIINEEAA